MFQEYKLAVSDYGPLANAYIPTVALVLESANSKLESDDCNADSNSDPVTTG